MLSNISSTFILLSYLLYLILFSCSLSLILSKILNLESSFSLFFSQSFLMVVIYLSGLIGLMYPVVVLLNIVSFSFVLTSLYIDQKYHLKILTFVRDNYLVFISLIIGAFFLKNQIIGNTDEFNYWASSVKEMLITDSLPDNKSALYYRMYLPGLSVYHYANLRIFNHLEPNIFLSYLLLNLSAINVFSDKLRSFNILRPILFFFLVWLSHKVLGFGFKLVLADQFLSNAFFACLFLIVYTAEIKKLRYLIVPIAAIVITKQPGIVIALILLVLICLKRFLFRNTTKILL